jgi:hypothetical protein
MAAIMLVPGDRDLLIAVRSLAIESGFKRSNNSRVPKINTLTIVSSEMEITPLTPE